MKVFEIVNNCQSQNTLNLFKQQLLLLLFFLCRLKEASRLDLQLLHAV